MAVSGRVELAFNFSPDNALKERQFRFAWSGWSVVVCQSPVTSFYFAHSCALITLIVYVLLLSRAYGKLVKK